MSRLFTRFSVILGLCTVSACATSTTQVVTTSVGVPQQTAAAHPVIRVPASSRYRVVDKIVKKDTDVLLDYWASVNADCTTQKYQVLQLERKPGHGTASFSDFSTHPAFPSTNPHSACNSHTITATALHYRSDPGYTGFDVVPVTASDPLGSIQNVVFRVRVVD